MRKKKLIYNTVSSLIYQIVTIVCGFILPRVILNYYGSEVNGLVNSITQFLQIIAFLDLGIGAVVKTSLYKPLADGDNKQISMIYCSADKFFKNLARILVIYIIILMIIYPNFIDVNFGIVYTITLIIAIGISYFATILFWGCEWIAIDRKSAGVYTIYCSDSNINYKYNSLCYFNKNRGFDTNS